MIFFAAGNNENKNIYEEKRKKNMVQIWNGLLPNCILREWELYCNTGFCIAVRNLGWVRKETVLQYSLLVLDCIAGCKAKLYCKRKPLHSIVAGLRVFILQYTVLYCRKISVLQ